MTGETGAPIETSADAIVSRDVQEGRPGKTATTPTWPWWATAAAVAAAVAFLVSLGLGWLLGGNAAGTTVATTPDTPVTVTAEKPDAGSTTTVPANPTYNAQVQGQVQFVCNGNPAPYPFVGQLQIGDGGFNLTSPQMSPFVGSVASPSLAVTAGGQSGNLTGTLATGSTQTFSLITQDTGFPCIGGPYPFVVQLQTPINASPTTGTTTSALVGSQLHTTLLWNPVAVLDGKGGINWPLVALGGGALVVGGVDLWYHRKKKREAIYEIFGVDLGDDDDDDDDDGPRISPLYDEKGSSRPTWGGK